MIETLLASIEERGWRISDMHPDYSFELGLPGNLVVWRVLLAKDTCLVVGIATDLASAIRQAIAREPPKQEPLSRLPTLAELGLLSKQPPIYRRHV
jgi:hypothetical protein